MARVTLAFGLSAVPGLGLGLAHSSSVDMLWHMGAALGALATCFVVFTGGPRLRGALRVVLGVYTLAVLLIVLSEGLGVTQLFPVERTGRVRLLFANPNLLAANITLTSLGLSSLTSRCWHKWILLVLSAWALLLIGSRSGLVACVLGSILILIASRQLSIRVKVVALVILGTGVLALGSIARSLQPERNLLTLSEIFDHPIWSTGEGSAVSIDANVVAGPFPGSWGSRISGRSGSESRVILLQGPGTSKAGKEYVASVYLRSESSGELILRTQLSTTVCRVSSAWQRCETPPGVGDGRLHVQFRLETIEFSEEFDFYIWGAQLEIGPRASDYESRSLLPYRLRRFIPENVSGSLNAGRVDAWRAALEMALERPWTGVGVGRFRESYEALSYVERSPWVSHAHNLVLQVAAEGGLLAVVSWLTSFVGGTLAVTGFRLRNVAPLISAVLCLNLFDYTYHHVAVYYPYWALLVMMSVGREGS